ncbi:hypothetical protein GCM10010394_19820 [Streptomyces crystallinus]|uniref:Uncharacterized protein n=1 Tax=Streptomyces crystallinus TaxID=68191 RepID=A0ABP3QGM5_9ACTN
MTQQRPGPFAYPDQPSAPPGRGRFRTGPRFNHLALRANSSGTGMALSYLRVRVHEYGGGVSR